MGGQGQFDFSARGAGWVHNEFKQKVGGSKANYYFFFRMGGGGKSGKAMIKAN